VTKFAHLTHLPCSREGAALADGLAYLFKIAVIVTVLVLLAAILSGIVVGLRKGQLGKQLLKHLGLGLLVLVLLPPLGYAGWMIRNAVTDFRVRRDEADFARWLQPFSDLKPGMLGPALDQVLITDKNEPGRILYLVLWLQTRLDEITFEPTDADRDVLARLPERLVHELEMRHSHTDPSNIQGLRGAAIWLRFRPDLSKATDECGRDDHCLNRLADSWWSWCRRDLFTCRQGTPELTIDDNAARYADHQHFRSVLIGTSEYLKKHPTARKYGEPEG
jgi:hypothetical protein